MACLSTFQVLDEITDEGPKRGDVAGIEDYYDLITAGYCYLP